MNTKNKRNSGFSLVELMIALIAISIIIAALSPMITKNLSRKSIKLAGSQNLLSTNCNSLFTNGECSFCNISTKECVKCNLTCTTSGQFLNSKKCTCTNCSEKFKDADDDSISSCIACDKDKCTKCNPQHYLQDTKCTTCEAGKFCNGITAKSCPQGNYCQNGAIFECPDGTYNNNTDSTSINDCLNCTSKVPFCKTCDKRTGNCTTCENNYILDTKNNTCIACAAKNPNCSQCSTDGTCKICKENYVLDNNNQCVPCSQVHPHCAFCNQNGTCKTCISNYVIKNNQCVPLSEVSPNCKTWEQGRHCVECTSNKFALANGECKSCSYYMTGCDTCANINQCITCSPNYIKSGNSCIDKNAFDPNCNTWNSSNTACSICKTGYKLYGGKCVPCSYNSNCSSCTSDGACTACQEGFILSGNNCKTCREIYPNCKTCTTEYCTNCDEGYRIDYGVCKKKNKDGIPFSFTGAYLDRSNEKYQIIQLNSDGVLTFLGDGQVKFILVAGGAGGGFGQGAYGGRGGLIYDDNRLRQIKNGDRANVVIGQGGFGSTSTSTSGYGMTGSEINGNGWSIYSNSTAAESGGASSSSNGYQGNGLNCKSTIIGNNFGCDGPRTCTGKVPTNTGIGGCGNTGAPNREINRGGSGTIIFVVEKR